MPALGIDLGGTKIQAVVLDSAGRQVWDQRIATPADDYRATLRALAILVAQAQEACGVCSVGVGTPGTLSAAGLMKNSNSQCLNGRPLLADLRALLGQRVHIANDANCLALSEATDGAGAGAPVVFAVVLGTGTGAGIAVHGRVLNGPNGVAGEWGHNPLPWAEAGTDPLLDCYCGQRGCIETLLSGPGMARDHLTQHGTALSAQQIAAAAADGDIDCVATLQRYCRRLARALASVINLLDPDVIVLAGGVSQIDVLYPQVPALWGRWVVSGGQADVVRTRLLPSLYGDASGVRGAAWLGRRPDAFTSA
jgi:fructokinase